MRERDSIVHDTSALLGNEKSEVFCLFLYPKEGRLFRYCSVEGCLRLIICIVVCWRGVFLVKIQKKKKMLHRLLPALLLLMARPSHGVDTKTTTLSLTRSRSRTFSLSHSSSLSLPTSSASYSLSHSVSVSRSVSVTLPSGTQSSSGSISFSASLSESRPAVNNYSAEVLPASLLVGQEFRVAVTSLRDGSVRRAFNVTSPGTVVVRTYEHSSAVQGCAVYASTQTYLEEHTAFGLSTATSADGNRFAETAYTTLAAPSTAFVVCFRHSVVDNEFDVPDSMDGVWQDVYSTNEKGVVSTVFTPASGGPWYYLPEATVGQYAILQLASTTPGFNFTYSAATCTTNTDRCADGDSLKIVKSGSPCTYDHQQHGMAYYGSDHSNDAGIWSATASSVGRLEGATAGGVGVFGTQYSNPLVDTWAAGGSYYSANEDRYNATTKQPWVGSHAYVYLRLPEVVASYDVCFSSRQERAALRTLNSTTQIPLWRKLQRCTVQSACASNSASRAFAAKVEPVGWTLVDVTPLTWGDLVFDDSGETQLSNRAATGNAEATSTDYSNLPQDRNAANYWKPAGGDYYRLVRATYFSEALVSGRAGVQYGSVASSGCWTREVDTTQSSSFTPASYGGLVEDGVLYPAASKDLLGDPTAASPVHDADVPLGASYSALYLPAQRSQWHVCYRRTCTLTASTCAQHSGLRVLPFHNHIVGSTPTRYLHLNGTYPFASLLVPDVYDPAVLTPHPDVTWYMNDTRHATYGPFIVEAVNSSESGLDSRPWNYVRTYSGVDKVADTAGAVLRIVPAAYPCGGYVGLSTVVTLAGVQNADGGLIECDSSSATDSTVPGCAGSAADLQSVHHVAFYIEVPPPTTYVICFRLHGHNWRSIASTTTSPWNDPTHPMPDTFLQRSDWTQPSSFVPTSAQSDVSVTYTEARSGMEALFIINDATSALTAAPRGVCVGCSNGGDVFRIVPTNAPCDINPTTWTTQHTLADTALSPTCMVAGDGSQNTSGLFTTAGNTACATSSSMQRLCSWTLSTTGSTATGCHWSDPALSGITDITPHPYDDIVPYVPQTVGYSAHQGTVSAVVVLPSTAVYRLCFKKVDTPNWLVLNNTFEVTAAAGYVLESPQRGLVAGVYQSFVVSGSGASGVAAASFRAKLVKVATTDTPANTNAHLCANPPGSLQGAPYAAHTTTAELASGTLTFRIPVPHEAGHYTLCMQHRTASDDTMSWWRPRGRETAFASFVVVDSNVRWHTLSGARPTNGGISQVHLSRVGGVAFNTTAGGDAVKVVSAASSCHDASSSVHIGLEGGGAGGITDLGPAEGASFAPFFATTLPHTVNSEPTVYRVCVRTIVPQYSSVPVWVEVPQAVGLSGQVQVLSVSGDVGFYTQSAVVDRWSVVAALRPKYSMFTFADAAATVIAGASTQYVTNPTSAKSAVTVGTGFKLHATEDRMVAKVASSDRFKFVLRSVPTARTPPDQNNTDTWGDVAGWSAVAADCLSPGTPGASNEFVCTDTNSTAGVPFCPQLSANVTLLTINVLLQVPVDTGMYLVCFKSGDAPWVQLREQSTGTVGLYTHPSFLEADLWATSKNVSIVDVRTVPGAAQTVPLASWCAVNSTLTGGVACSTQNANGFDYDLAVIARASQVCPAPTAAPGGSTNGAPEWFRLQRESNASVSIEWTWGTATSSQFSIPPPGASSQHPYKLCVYKASYVVQPYMSAVDAAVVVHGVTYQLYNRGSASEGGGSGLWRASSGIAAQLSVTTDVAFNSTTHFVQHNATTEAAYSTIPASTLLANGVVSHTPILLSGSVVQFTVQLQATSGEALLADTLVEVQVCSAAKTWAEVSCSTIDPKAFVVVGVGGVCTAAQAPGFGWPDNGLQQFMQKGEVVFRLQYRSACPHAEAGFGCGLRFVTTYSGTTVVSPPQWVNIPRQPADQLAVNTQPLLPSNAIITTALSHDTCATSASTTPTPCYVVPCVHGQPCVLRIQAYRNSRLEHAVNGTFQLELSPSDYGSTYPKEVEAAVGRTMAAGQQFFLSDATWPGEGVVVVTLRPLLLAGHDAVYVFYRATSGGGGGVSGRFAVHVFRAVPDSVHIDAVVPLDASSPLATTVGKFPAPSVVLVTTSTTTAVAAGCYLEALTPYKAVFTFRSKSIRITPGPGMLTGWSVAAGVLGETADLVLSVPVDAREMYTTVPEVLMGSVLQHAFNDSDTLVEAAVRFRVYVTNTACSRFNAAGGCTVQFRFTHKVHTAVEAALNTPVRVPAATTMVTTSTTTASVREGLQVTVIPGTWVQTPSSVAVVFVPDEFHHARAFALLDGLPPTNGATNRDRLTMRPDNGTCVYLSEELSLSLAPQCLVEGYAMRELRDTAGQRSWGAQWTMRPQTPCNRCDFSFHTTLGAGPDGLGSDGTAGVRTLTWTEETLYLNCSAAVTVGFHDGASASNAFGVTLAANVAGLPGVRPQYNRWSVGYSWRAVQGDAAYTLTPPAQGGTVNVGAQAVRWDGFAFDGFNGSIPTNGTPETFALTFTAEGLRYASGDSALSGSPPIARSQYTCTTEVSLVWQPQPTPNVTYGVELVTVSGVRSACPTGVAVRDCSDYVATVNEMEFAGLSATVSFHRTETATDGTVTTATDTTARNITVVPFGGLNSTETAIGWNYSNTTSLWMSSDLVLDSAYNVAGMPTNYTFGQLDVVCIRQRADTVHNGAVHQGLGNVKLVLGSASGLTYRSPVRSASFRICASSWNASSATEDTTTLCTVIRLWVTPNTTPTKTLALTQQPSGNVTRGASSTCGATSLTYELATSYQVTGGPDATWRYIVYDVPLQYSLTAPAGQHVVISGSHLEVASLLRSNNVTSGQATHSEAWDALLLTYTLTGRDVASGGLYFSAKNVAATSDVITGVTSNSLFWVDPTETIASWELADTVTEAEECLPKRRLMTSTHGYRTYGPGVPAEGWRYTDTAAVSAGTLFPLQTVVRTSAGLRARSFGASAVRVTKRSWEGCNDGGLLGVYQMAGSQPLDTTVNVEGALGAGFAPGVTTVAGVAVVWVRFEQECARCTLQLDLCFAGRVAGSACLQETTAPPTLAERTKITLPFTVVQPKPSTLQVKSQDIPPGAEVTVHVGESMSVTTEMVHIHANNWAMLHTPTARKLWTKRVWVRTVYQHSTSSGVYYGNGGFVRSGERAGGRAVGCAAALLPAEAQSALPRAQLSENSAGAALFSVTRPCSACTIHIDYELIPPPGDVRSSVYGSLPLRTLTNGVPSASGVLFRVKACGVQWMVERPPRSVRVRSAFSITAVAADAHNHPVWEGNATVSSGMGGAVGGAMWDVTSPALRGRVRAVEGSATLRLRMGRACFRCVGMFGATVFNFAALAEATRLLLAPTFPAGDAVSPATPQWTFNLFAADAYGDRAYLLGGPTLQPWHAPYATSYPTAQARLPRTLSAAVPPTQRLAATLAEAPSVSTILRAHGAASVKHGAKLHNGVPYPRLDTTKAVSGASWDAGKVTVKMTSTVPTVLTPLALSVGRVTSAAMSPFDAEGWSALSAVAMQAPATHLAVDGGDCGLVRSEGSAACTILTYAAAEQGGSYYLSGSADGAASFHATVDCGRCGAAKVTTTGQLSRGTGNVTLAFLGLADAATEPSCTCNITMHPKFAQPQSLLVTFEDTVLEQWTYGSTATVSVVGAAVSPAVVAASAVNRSVSIAFTAYDSSLLYSGLGAGQVGGAFDNGFVVGVVSTDMRPEGCFQCAETATVDITPVCKGTVHNAVGSRADTLHVHGVFRTAGVCVLSTSAFINLPTTGSTPSSSPYASLTVTVGVPDHIVIAKDATGLPMQRPLFHGLWGRTAKGVRAGVVGERAVLVLQVVDVSGNVVRGDNQMQFGVSGVRVGDTTGLLDGEVFYAPQEVVTAKAGVATVPLPTTHTTRTALCQNVTTPDQMYSCTHAPWRFKIVATEPLVVSATSTAVIPKQFAVLQDIGPFHVVGRAMRLRAQFDAAQLTAGGHNALEWGYAHSMVLEVSAVSSSGEVVTHPEDVGSFAEVVFRPFAAPCGDVDRGEGGMHIFGTCISQTRPGVSICSSAPVLPQQPCDLPAATGWSAPPTFALTAGRATLDVIYGANGAVHSGLTRFLLSTDLAYPWSSGWDDRSRDGAGGVLGSSPYAMEKTFLFAMLFRRAAAVVPVGAVCAKVNATLEYVHPPSSVPQILIFRCTAANRTPSEVFSLSVEVVDRDGKVVVADSSSVVSVSGRCDQVGVSAYLGRMVAGAPHFVDLGGVRVVRGVATVRDLLVTRQCARMVVTVTTTGTMPNGTTLATDVVFAVAAAGGPQPPAAVPDPWC